MKKILTIGLILGIGFGASAQDKKVRAGLVMGTNFNWTKIQTTKIERNGIGNGFVIGMAGDFMFNDNIGLSSGVQFSLESFKLNYGSSTNANLGNVFYAYNDTDIEVYKDGSVKDFTDSSAFELLTRKYRAKYITIPFFLKFQTNMIGQFRYYGKFGARIDILAGVRMDDEGYDAKYDASSANLMFDRVGSTTRTMENLKPVGIKKELSPVRMAVGIYGGSEWNFTGNTFLYAEMGFNYGILPNLYPTSGNLVDRVSNGTTGGFNYSNLDIKNNPQHIIEIKVGLLF